MVVLDPRLETQDIDEDLIAYITDKIVKTINPKRLILFGSLVKGKARQGSDVDLFLLYDGEERTNIIHRKVDELFWGREFPLDVLVRRPEDVMLNMEASNTFYIDEILGKGRVLYERP